MLIKKFKCKHCGECCRDFESDLLKDIPIKVFDTPVTLTLNHSYLTIYDWEADIFIKELKKINSERNILPSLVSFDMKSERTIVQLYTLDGQNCPFYVNNRCSIYERRPFVCREFPCIQDLSGLITGKSIGLSKNLLCGFEKEDDFPENLKLDTMTIPDFIKILYERYGESFYYKIASDNYSICFCDQLFKLDKNGRVNLAKKGYPINFLLKRIEKSPQITISELIREQTGIDITNAHKIELAKKMVKELIE